MKKPTKQGTPEKQQEAEQRLIILARAGDKEAFGELVHNNLERIYSLAFSLSRNRYDAEEITQEVFLKAIKNIHSFRSDSSIGTWLYRITVNTYLNTKKSRLFHPLEDHHENRDIDSVKIKSANESENDFINSIDKILVNLSEKEHAVFVLRHYESFHIKEIAAMLGISYGTVRTLLYRAVRKLRIELSNPDATRKINKRKQ
jgi:RNA polymerase sigma-70 factor (ECF subfamily)